MFCSVVTRGRRGTTSGARSDGTDGLFETSQPIFRNPRATRGVKAHMTTLAARIERAIAARPEGTITFVGGGQEDRVLWARLHDEARAMAPRLQARGVGP